MEPAILPVDQPLRRTHSNVEWERLVAHSPAVLYTLKIQGDEVFPVFISDNVERLLGFTPEESTSYQWWLDNLHPEDRDHAVATLGAALEHDCYSMEYRLRHRDGSFRWVEDHSRVLRTAGGQPHEMIGVLIDITERKLADEALKMQGRVLECMSEGVTVSDETGLIVFSNDACNAMFGYAEDELVGQHWSVLRNSSPQQSRQFVNQLLGYLQENGGWMGELNTRKKDGAAFITRARISSLEIAGSKSFVSVFEDITEKRGMEAQFLRSQRMDSLGRLSSGIAHDLNNILTPILMAVFMLRRELPQGEFEKTVKLIETNTLRGADLVKQLLSFEHGIEGQREVLQPNELVREIVKMAAGTFPKDITIVSRLAEDCWPLVGTATQLHQVLLNLCVNARDAMPAGGTLTFTTKNLHFDDNYVAMNAAVTQGHYVLIQVADTGAGIPADILDKVFDPFFTTKQREGNAGLGLSTVISIIKSHDGLMNLRSEVNRGSTFEIYLPASPDGIESGLLRLRFPSQRQWRIDPRCR
ncbi:MAG: PAS domain S-box protein [Prosthecobacter sp.]|nr:PAS domain S-box protein [Prosthecobacter sp.]